MPLAAGSRFGAFDILAPLGAGGMGEVYRARDTKLGRDVALKILPHAFAGDEERLARFEREARVLASLNHPLIAQIHGVEESGAIRALVMELVEGDDLARRIASGPIPLDDALPMAMQIAEAVEGAHELGIIHRDLKPANIKVRPDGTVKVLDFGLAKALEPGPAIGTVGEALNSPTITSPAMTMRGVILGTAAYMAPEQAKGKAVDKRVDVWAFGCVLYEMLTGRRPFPGDDVSDTLAFVLTKDVDWSALPSPTPLTIRTLLRHCLQKNPRDRLRDIGDARLAIRDAMAASDAAPPVERRSTFAARVPWVVAITAIVAAAILGVIAWRRPAAAVSTVTRLVIPPPRPSESLSDPVIAPDGSFVVFRGNQLYVRRLSEFDARPLPGTERAEMPFLSPDAQWVGFFADGKMKKVSLAGGDPIVICDAEADSPGAAWGAGDRIFFTATWTGAPLVAVSANGGPVTTISTLDAARRERGHWWPEPLPDGRHVLFTIWFAGAGLSESQIGVLDLDTGQHRALFPGAFPRYAAGHLVFFRAGVFQAVRFDPGTLTATSEPRLVLAEATAMNAAGSSAKPLGLSESGSLAYTVAELVPERTVSWLHRDGRTEATPLKFRTDDVALSPDGTKVAYGRLQNGTSQIAVYDLARNTEQRLQSPGYNFHPVWHPDGQRMTFTSMRKGDFDIYIEQLGGAAAEPVIADDGDEALLGWLPGAKRFIATVWEPSGPISIVLVDPGSRSVPLVTGQFSKGLSALSPDGRWLALCANPAGSWQLYVRPVSAAGSLQPVGTCRSDDQGVQWSPHTNELLFLRETDLVSLTYSDRNGRFAVDTERIVVPIGARDRFFGVSPDGQRFLIGKRTTSSSDENAIRVVVNGLGSLLKTPAP